MLSLFSLKTAKYVFETVFSDCKATALHFVEVSSISFLTISRLCEQGIVWIEDLLG